MNEVYYEETAFPYNYSRQRVYYILCNVMAVLFALTALFFVFILLLSPVDGYAWVLPLIFIVWNILMIVLVLYIRSKQYNCFDYIFVTGDIRIIKVINTKKRRKMIIVDSKDVFQVGRYESETYNKYKNMPGVKVVFAPTNKFVADKPKYYLAATFEGVKYLIVLECTEKFLRYVLQFSGKHVLEKEF